MDSSARRRRPNRPTEGCPSLCGEARVRPAISWTGGWRRWSGQRVFGEGTAGRIARLGHHLAAVQQRLGPLQPAERLACGASRSQEWRPRWPFIERHAYARAHAHATSNDTHIPDTRRRPQHKDARTLKCPAGAAAERQHQQNDSIAGRQHSEDVAERLTHRAVGVALRGAGHGLPDVLADRHLLPRRVDQRVLYWDRYGCRTATRLTCSRSSHRPAQIPSTTPLASYPASHSSRQPSPADAQRGRGALGGCDDGRASENAPPPGAVEGGGVSRRAAVCRGGQRLAVCRRTHRRPRRPRSSRAL